MPDDNNNLSAQGQQETKNLAADVHWITHATFWSQIGLGIIGIIALVIYYGQLRQMTKATTAATNATKASIWSAYWACLSSQSAHDLFEQSRIGAYDTHAMAVASIQQAAAETEDAASSLLFSTRVADPGENLSTNFAMVAEAKNVGKGDAYDTTVNYWAILLKKGELLNFKRNPKRKSYFSLTRFPAGLTYPERAKPPHGQLVRLASVQDASGNTVLTTSEDVIDLMNGGSTEAYVFGDMSYTDIAGYHAERFCQIIWEMRANTQKLLEPSDNDRRCVRYNSRKPQRTYKPQAQPPLLDNGVGSQIECRVPKED